MKYRLFILLIGMTWLMLLCYLLQLNYQDFIFPDAQSYQEAAALLYRQGQLHCYRPVLTAFFFGLPYAFAGSDATVYQFGFYLNIFCWLGNALLVFSMTKQFLNERKAFYLALVYVFIIGSALLTFHLLTENLYAFVSMVGFFFFSKYYRDENYLNLSIALSIFLLSALIKPGAQLFALFCLLWHARTIAVHFRKPSQLFLLGSIVVLGLQLWQMKRQYGNFTISYIGGVTYYNYLGAKADGFNKQVSFAESKKHREDHIFKLSLPEQLKVAEQDFKMQLTHNTSHLIKSYGLNLIENAGTPSDALSVLQNKENVTWFDPIKTMMIVVSKWQNRILSVLGLFLGVIAWMRFRNNHKPILLASAFVLYTIFISGLSCFQGDRFHVVLYPVIIWLAAEFYHNRIHRKAN